MDRVEFSFLSDVLAVFDRHDMDLEFEVDGLTISASEHITAKLKKMQATPKKNPFRLVK